MHLGVEVTELSTNKQHHLSIGQRLALIDAISTSGLKLVLDYHSAHDGVEAWLQGLF
jgi:hypothetical protein